MKRTQPEKSNKSSSNTPALEPSRLTAVHGGRGLRITVAEVDLPPFVGQQHNEILVGVWTR
jgi:hypothetical protein